LVIVVLLLTLPGAVLSACSDSDPDANTDPGTGPDAEVGLSEDGPYVRNDPGGIIKRVAWIANTAFLPLPSTNPSRYVGELLENSTPEALRIAINGPGCRPQVLVSVNDAPANLELFFEIGEPVLEPGQQCPETLKTHGIELTLTQRVVLENVSLSVGKLRS
jgi:hypothetical protein